MTRLYGRRALYSTTKGTSESIAAFDSRLTDLQSDLNFYGIATTDRARFLQLIADLQESEGYEKILQEFDILPDDFDVDRAMNQIRNLEVRLGHKEPSSLSQTIQVNNPSAQQMTLWCNTHGYGIHATSECRNSGPPTEKAKWPF